MMTYKNDLDIELVRCFLKVAEYLNFTAAARELGRTQSAITIRVQKLEELIGHPLFERSSRKVKLTVEGKAFLPHALRLTEYHDNILSVMREDTPLQCIRIGVAEYLFPNRISKLIQNYQVTHPNLEIQIRLGLSRDILCLFDEGLIDIAITLEDAGRTSGLNLIKEPLYWVAGLSYKANPKEPLPLCFLPAPCLYRTAGIDALKNENIRWKEIVTANSIFGIQSALMTGIGCSIIGASAIQPEVIKKLPSSNLPKLPHSNIVAYGNNEKIDFLSPLLEEIGNVKM